LHKLGGDQWSKAKKKAIARIRDVAAELLEIHANRAIKQGHAFVIDDAEYQAFADAFPFEETPDQQAAIEMILDDMASPQPMDRVICGDVGFGKTEVSMRAAFIAVQRVNKWRYWCRLRCWHSSITRIFLIVLPIGRYG
jgi:transcription-repair coupling factor (superfamily II helicase)